MRLHTLFIVLHVEMCLSAALNLRDDRPKASSTISSGLSTVSAATEMDETTRKSFFASKDSKPLSTRRALTIMSHISAEHLSASRALPDDSRPALSPNDEPPRGKTGTGNEFNGARHLAITDAAKMALQWVVPDVWSTVPRVSRFITNFREDRIPIRTPVHMTEQPEVPIATDFTPKQDELMTWSKLWPPAEQLFKSGPQRARLLNQVRFMRCIELIRMSEDLDAKVIEKVLSSMRDLELTSNVFDGFQLYKDTAWLKEFASNLKTAVYIVWEAAGVDLVALDFQILAAIKINRTHADSAALQQLRSDYVLFKQKRPPASFGLAKR